ncbi:acyl-CoA dehydrogenase family protein [Oryzibacter oryziterrae]|uniref:acyl-CoA dehydrogenase family protein n=1 Tax=Oryzibacter oryziterrae TaxID=2766474 RepID=UPI001F4844ED|nr:acyl-CoA dehydrogenase family protein [Oryzibacter oryziterrae]
MNAMGSFTANRLADRVRRVAAIAAQYTNQVDAENRVPREAVEALKIEKLLSVMVPVELGGEGATTAEIADACAILGTACGSSAMIFAMHQIKMSSLVEHGMGSEWHRDLMARICAEQLVMGSATTEAGIGGNLRNSICHVEVTGDRFKLDKAASCISYAEISDAIMVTSRAHKDAAPTDQVMTVVMKDQYSLERTHEWNVLGMRGTRSEGFMFRSEGDACQILPQPFAEIAAESMLAQAHILWGALWWGIAADACARAQSFIRSEARRNPGQTPVGAPHLVKALGHLQMIKSNLLVAIDQYEMAKRDHDYLQSVGYGVAINLLKVTTSETILEIINECMNVCGLPGYRMDTPYSLGRHLRDAHSAQLMISNDRVKLNVAGMLAMTKPDTSLLG